MLGLLRRRPQLLTERQDALREQVRAALVNLRAALQRFGADVAPGDARTLDDALASIEELFLLVIAGEFNSGKSSFVNALLGDTVVAEGVTPTTDRITLLRHGDEPSERTVEEFLAERRFPAEVLRTIAVVDTPGTNAIIRRHEELTRDFIPRSDLVMFITSADRPFTESERSFLAMIREWGKKIVIVLNKVDLLETEAEREQVLSFIRENARDLFGFVPEIFPVSARLAKRARAEGNEEAWRASNFEAMERYILETLDEEERVRLKLLSPLGVARRLADKYLQAAEGRLGTLQHDVGMLENIERQLELFREDLGNDFKYHQTEVENILNEFELRAMRFFDETIRVGNVPRLVRDQEGIRQEFESEVVGDLPQQIEARIQGLIDWMIEKNLRLWQSTTDYLRRERAPDNRAGMIGEIGGSFEYNRAALIDSVARRAHQVVATYDREVESRALAEEVRSAIAGSALVGAGAVGLGALLVALLHTAALDVTGILAAGVLAVGGLYIIPNKRRQVKNQFRQRVAELREQLVGTMQRQFSGEADQMVRRLREAIEPYTRFIRSEQGRLVEVQGALSDVDVELGRLRSEIGGD
jgi:small GTP-binding protein